MVTRRRKLLAAAVVLIVGLGLAWPLRRTVPLGAVAPPASHAIQPQVLPRPVVLDDSQPPSPNAHLRTVAQEPVGASGDPAVAGPAAASAPFSTVSNHAGPAAAIPEPDAEPRVHVVHQGDSLDRLAARYLGDESRAIEIFDLNRDVLENPHLLPIGAELRLPPAP